MELYRREMYDAMPQNPTGIVFERDEQAERDAELGAAVRKALATNGVSAELLRLVTYGMAAPAAFALQEIANALDAEAVPPVGEEAK